MYLVSACLVGVNCRYDGRNSLDHALLDLVNNGQAIAVCPEVLGHLPIPRACCEIVSQADHEQRVISNTGQDKTEAFLEGARKTLEVCQVHDINKAILKSKSPSCGYGRIYDGSFKGRLISGKGVTAKLLEDHGIQIFNEDNWKSFCDT